MQTLTKGPVMQTLTKGPVMQPCTYSHTAPVSTTNDVQTHISGGYFP